MTRSFLRSALAACAALALAGPSAALPRQPLSQFDVGRAHGVPEVLALCDLTAFLVTRPNVEASVIYAPEDQGNRWVRPMLYPDFRPPDTLFDIKIRDAFRRLQSAGAVQRIDVATARDRYDAPMIESYRFAGPADWRFLEHQQQVCAGLVRGYLQDPAAQVAASAGPHG